MTIFEDRAFRRELWFHDVIRAESYFDRIGGLIGRGRERLFSLHHVSTIKPRKGFHQISSMLTP